MFTGLVEEVGRIAELRPLENGRTLVIEADRVLEDLRPGDSIATDGVCLTATEIRADRFEVQAVATTLARTSLGSYEQGRAVNLERALALGDRLGGHLVQGHVDGVGRVRSIKELGELVLIDVDVPAEVAAVTVLHGSITVNGVSLTVNDVPEEGVVGLSIIPFTWAHTALSELREADPVNVEGDLIGKYVRQLLGRPGRARSEVAEDLLRGWGY